MAKRQKIYAVDWYRNGYCYRTTLNCTWDDVKYFKQVAKCTGDTIKHTVTGYK